MQNSHYSQTHAKKSLKYFVFGKGIGASLGIAYFIAVARHMPNVEYGIYILVLAVVDVFYLSTGFGLSTVAQRYVAEYKINSCSAQLRGFLLKIFLYRLFCSVFFVVALALFWPFIAHVFHVDDYVAIREIVFFLLVISASGFFLDEVLGSLLLQGLFQSLTISKTLIRLVCVIALVQLNGTIKIGSLLVIECGGSLFCLFVGHLLLDRSLAQESGCSETSSSKYENKGMWKASRKFYFVQLLGQIYGPNVVRLLVSRLLGIAQTATLGFAQSLADMLRNFLPAHLLAGWLRPLMVSRYLLRRDANDLAAIANLTLKLNLLAIVPLTVFFSLRGDAFGYWVSGGRYPAVGELLVFLTIMIGLQTAHLLLAMITITLEQPNANMVATTLAAACLPLSVVLILQLGASGAALGLLLCELVWLIAASMLLWHRGVRIAWDFPRIVTMIASGVVSALTLWLLGLESPSFIDLAGSALAVSSSFGILILILKPLQQDERNIMCEFIPARFVVI